MPMVFPSSPTVGQVFSSGGRSWVWTGSTWDSPAGSPFVAPGLTPLRTVSFTAQNAVTVDNVFSTLYDHYKVLMTFQTSGSAGHYIQLRANGATVAGTDYVFQTVRVTGTSVSGLAATSGSSWPSFNSVGANRNTNILLNVYDPARPIQTLMDRNSLAWDGSRFGGTTWGMEGNNLARDGITISQDTGFTMTGTIRIYGYRN